MVSRWHIAALMCVAWLWPCLTQAQSVATWRETTHDFGTFHESQGKQSCAFVVTNTGDSALVIVRVQSTCGCTVASHPTMPIPPGGKDSISVTFSPTGRPGPFEKDVWVYTNSATNRTRLTVKGLVIGTPESVRRYFPVSAGENLQFTSLAMATGEVKKGLMRNSTITAYNSSSDSLVITFDNNTSHITPKAVPDTVPPGGISTMSFFFNSMLTPVWGINDDKVTIIATPLHEDLQPISVQANVVANVVEDFSDYNDEDLAHAPECSLSTDKLLIQNLTSGTNSQCNLTITNTGKSNLVVRRVMSLDKAVKTKCDKTRLKPGEKATVSVTVNPGAVDGNVLNSQFTVITNDPANPRITVRVVGEKK